MAVKFRWLAVTTLFGVALIAFFAGRTVEERAVAAKARANARLFTPSPATLTAAQSSHRELSVTEIVALPFAEFYEALRSAPAEAREKWASELAAMPKGPRRTAAVSGFYKLLVQFDPAAAAKTIGEIEDVGLQRLALGSAVNAAPGFAMPLIAKLSLGLQDRLTGKRDYVADVVVDWAFIDAPAAADFLDEHAEAFDEFNRGRYFTTYQVISAWAAVDPKATKEWIDRTDRWGGWEVQKFFVDGWYENDRAAAVSYTLAHVNDPDMSGAIGGIVLSLYIDSKQDAVKFIESLPEDKRPEALRDAFHNVVLGLGSEEETGETVLTERAVASWIIEFPPAYWNETLGRLFSFSATDMISWIEQLPPAIREAVAAHYECPLGKSPSDIITPILRVSDPVFRDQLLRAVVRNESLDRDEAGMAIASALLSDEQKNHLHQIIAAVEAKKKPD